MNLDNCQNMPLAKNNIYLFKKYFSLWIKNLKEGIMRVIGWQKRHTTKGTPRLLVKILLSIVYKLYYKLLTIKYIVVHKVS